MLYISTLRGIITDTHFAQRDRMGRLVGFVSRIIKDNSLPTFRGYAANEKSAFDADENGIGQLATYKHNNMSACYFIQAFASPDDVIQPRTPLTLGNPITVFKLLEGNKFDIPNWRFVPGAEGIKYVLTVKNGILQAIGNNGNIY
jgi:cyanophycinase